MDWRRRADHSPFDIDSNRSKFGSSTGLRFSLGPQPPLYFPNEGVHYYSGA